MNRLATRLSCALGVTLVLSFAAADVAEARRGGSFGSRGMRTYQQPRATPTSPNAAAPIQRSMTPQQKAAPQAGQPGAAAAGAQAPARRGFGGMGAGLLGGLVAGGLLGMMMGNGFGGMAGMGNMLMQLALVAGAAFLIFALIRRFRGAQPAGQGQRSAYSAGGANPPTPFPAGFGNANRSFEPARDTYDSATYAPQSAAAPSGVPLEIGLIQSDRDAFERLLTEVQDAFGAEDYAALRARTTPEIMSYLSEELSQNATQGRRNEVTGTRLIQADVAEAWREDETDYATAAMQYESVDIMRDRQTGAVVSGDERPTTTTELWTFARQPGGDWKLSAIQEA